MGFLKDEIENLLTHLREERDFYNRLIEPGLKGGLIAMKRGSGTTYLHSVPCIRSDGKKGYSRKTITDRPERIRALATNAYASSALSILDRNIHRLEMAQAGIVELTAGEVFRGMSKVYRKLPENYYCHLKTEGVMERYRDWMAAPYEQSDYKPENRRYDTGRGIHVRSKAEVILVEKFYQFGIPFRYEEVLRIDGYSLAPDFTFPDRSGDKFYLEYCGMMDNENYVRNFMWKRNKYEEAGIRQWHNMIYIFDRNNEMNVKRIEGIIRTEILPRL